MTTFCRRGRTTGGPSRPGRYALECRLPWRRHRRLREGDPASKPHDAGILNNYAWVLATAPEDKLRDGHKALAMAIDACKQTDYKEDYILSTLAAAYAEIGRFQVGSEVRRPGRRRQAQP